MDYVYCRLLKFFVQSAPLGMHSTAIPAMILHIYITQVRIKGVAHGSLLGKRFSAKAQTDNRRLPVPAVVMVPCSTLTITPR